VHHEGSLLEETGDLAIGSGDHLADSATETYLRELDEGLEENAEHLLDEIDAALVRIDDGSYGSARRVGGPSRKSGSRRCPTRRCASTTSVPWSDRDE
jgi:hypothetical protein